MVLQSGRRFYRRSILRKLPEGDTSFIHCICAKILANLHNHYKPIILMIVFQGSTDYCSVALSGTKFHFSNFEASLLEYWLVPQPQNVYSLHFNFWLGRQELSQGAWVESYTVLQIFEKYKILGGRPSLYTSIFYKFLDSSDEKLREFCPICWKL